MKACTIYRVRTRVVIACMHETDAGVYKLDEPIKFLESCGNPMEIGNAVLEVIGQSTSGLPAHSTGTGVVPKILKAAGMKSWRSFESDLRECQAELFDDAIQLTPLVRTGGGSGIGLEDRKQICDLDPGRLGEAVLRTLD